MWFFIRFSFDAVKFPRIIRAGRSERVGCPHPQVTPLVNKPDHLLLGGESFETPADLDVKKRGDAQGEHGQEEKA